MRSNRILLCALTARGGHLCLPCPLLSVEVLADDYPSRPIRIVVGFAWGRRRCVGARSRRRWARNSMQRRMSKIGRREF
jgi:hypothetical protein